MVATGKLVKICALHEMVPISLFLLVKPQLEWKEVLLYVQESLLASKNGISTAICIVMNCIPILTFASPFFVCVGSR